jgi:hypothetical protein
MIKTISIYGILRCTPCYFTSLFKALKGGDSLSKGMNDEEKKDLME